MLTSLLTSLDPTTLLLGGVLSLSLVWWLSTRRPSGLPPGPGPALPLVGHLHLMKKDSRKQLLQWARQYGDVFSLYIGSSLVVVLSSYSAIHETLVKMGDVFSDRPHDFQLAKMANYKGVFSASGAIWKEQRKLSLEILRGLGLGKNVLADRVLEEIECYVEAIKAYQGAPVDLAGLTEVSISNNICSVVFGQRFDYKDHDFKSNVEDLSDIVKILTGTGALNYFPILEHLPGDLFNAKKARAKDQHVLAFIRKQVEKHRQSYSEGEESTDFIHGYLRHLFRHERQGNKATTVNDEYLLRVTWELFLAGTDTTSTSLLWAMLYFLHYPEVQDKCYREICEVIGPDRLPSIRDKENLVYVEATVMEALRKGEITPLSGPHTTNKDVTFRGYFIPKGATVIPFVSSVLQDPKIWGDPQNFRPERFIGPDGKLVKQEELINFSLGRRRCLGESLARTELFLYLTTLIQRFRFEPAQEGQLPPLEGVLGLSYSPQHYRIRAVPRE